MYNAKSIEDCATGTCVLDLERRIMDSIRNQPWQTDTCIGAWHYDREVYANSKYKSPKMVIDLLVDLVSRNGNLLLNFPLRSDGTLDEKEMAVLEGITKWMAVNGEAIYGTRPWRIFGEGPGTQRAQAGRFNEGSRKELTAQDVRFTTKGRTLYAFVMGWPEREAVIAPLAAGGKLQVGKIRNVQLLGFKGKLEWKQDETALKVKLPVEKPSDYAVAFRIAGAFRH